MRNLVLAAFAALSLTAAIVPMAQAAQYQNQSQGSAQGGEANNGPSEMGGGG